MNANSFFVILGPPSPPRLVVAAVNFQTFAFSIRPPVVAGPCVLNYTITPTSSDGNMLTDITVDVAPIVFYRSGFDLCSNTYSFTAVAASLTYTGERSGPTSINILSEYVY